VNPTSMDVDLEEAHRLLRKVMDKEPLSQDEAVHIWHEIHRIMSLTPGANMLLCVYDHLTKELSKGKRCGVCGRYENKDCWRDC